MERRTVGQKMQEAKQKREEEEAIAAAKQYRKEKREDQMAREAIRYVCSLNGKFF